MTDVEGTIVIHQSDDGILLLGPEDSLSVFDHVPQLRTHRITQRTLARAANATELVSVAQAKSGRWLKLTPESAAYLRDAGVKVATSGVVRRNDLPAGRGSQIVKHLKFERLPVATPAAPAALAAMATQAALEAALADIAKYLAAIDAKLDQLLKQRKIEVLGQLGGVTLAIEEADTIHTETGAVSSVTWSKVQANSLALQMMQVEAVAQLNALADYVREAANDTDGAAQALFRAQKDAPFWLGVLARTMALQDRQYVLELARVGEDEPTQLEAHRQGIRIVRAKRTRRIVESLESISASVRECADLTNLDRVANPFSAQQVTRGANGVNDSITEFAEHADLELAGADRLDGASWGRAAKALLGDATSQVSSAGRQVTGRTKLMSSRLQERRDEAILSRAVRVQDKRRSRREISPPGNYSGPGGAPGLWRCAGGVGDPGGVGEELL